MMDLTAYVSHLGHVIKFDLLSGPAQPSKNSEDLIFSESEKRTVNLQATSFKFSSERRCFQEEMQTRTCVHGCEVVADGKIVLAECVRESRTGLVLPCVLVQRQVSAKDFVTLFFLYSPTSNRIFLCGKVTTKHAIPPESAWLIDGPSACWRVDEMNGFLFIKKDAESGRFGLHRFVDDNKAKGSTIMYCSLSPENNLHIITIPQLKVHADDDSVECRWVSLILNSKQECCFTKSNQFVPDVYASIACCMLLMISDQHIPHGDAESFGDCLPLQQPPVAAHLKNTAYVATSMKQLLKFKNGVFCKLVSIPFDDAVEIVPMDTRGDKMLVVRSGEGAVCVISCTSFQVIQEWKNVSSLYIDDILGNGGDQLLMLLKPSEDPVCHQPFPEFILTDLDLCHVASNDPLLHDGKGQRSGEVQSVTTPKSLVTAMQALEAKVENGLTSLREQELSRQLKDRIISQSMENLAQMVTGVSNPIQRQQTLVHLCGTIPSQPSLAPPTASDTGGRLKVTAGWQRIVNEKWVIGCKVTNESHWPVADLKLLILPWKANSSREPVECEGYIQHPKSRGIIVDSGESESHRSSLIPPSKRSRLEDTVAPSASSLSSSSSSSSSSRPTGRQSSAPASPLMPGESCDAVATTTVPDFLDGPVASQLLVLQWTTHHPLQREQSGTTEGKVMSMICGHVCLGAADLIGHELAIKLPEIHPMLVKPTPQQVDHIVEGVLSRTDELALDASQLSTSVRVTSRYTHLPNLHKVLFRDMSFQEMGGGGGSGCLCNCTSGGLRGARVYFDNVRSNSTKLRVCTGDKREWMLFFHTLKSFLPVDVQFTLDTPTDCLEEAIKSSVTNMNNELQHMLRITDLACSTATGVNQHVKDGEGSRESPMEVEDGGDSVSRKQERLKRLREDFLKQQETAKYKDCTLTGNQAELLRTKLLELRENTDNAVTVLSKCI